MLCWILNFIKSFARETLFSCGVISLFDKIKIKVINKYAGTVEIKDSIKDVAEEYDLNYSNLKNLFSYHKKHNNTEKIQYKGLILEKIK